MNDEPDTTATFRTRRRAKYRELLSKDGEAGTLADVLGDQIDILIKQIESMRTNPGATTPEFSDLLGRVAAVKAAVPKPAPT